MAVQKGESIRVLGLREFQAELKALEGNWPRELTRAAKEAASLVLGAAQSAAAGQGGVAGHAAKSLRVTGGQRSASIWLGGDDHPEALGAEFGSIRFHQFKPYRGNAAGAGYFLYPSLRQQQPAVLDVYSAALERLFARAFPD